MNDSLLESERRIPLAVDAVFISTLGARPHLYRQIDHLASQCEYLFVTTSRDGSINWSEVSAPNVQELRLDDEHFQISPWQLDPAINPQRSVQRAFDLPAKRNLALVHSQQEGFRRIALIDDDILLPDTPLHIPDTAVDQWDGIGAFYVLDFPDISTVDCICAALTQTAPLVSLGGSCLVLDSNLFHLRFPHIYNEDWLFLAAAHLQGSTVISLGTVGQLSHSPWLDHSRVAFEQFGDVLAATLADAIPDASSTPQVDARVCRRAYRFQADRITSALAKVCSDSLRNPLLVAKSALEGFEASPVREFLCRWVNEQKILP